jgi:hypothetical protein
MQMRRIHRNHPALSKALPFDPGRLAPVSRWRLARSGFAVHPSLPADSVPRW